MAAMTRRTVATIEARMTSTRLPGKVLRQSVGKPFLELMIERLRRVPSLDGIVVATTINATDDPVAALAKRMGAGCHRGSEEDVLTRVLEAARAHGADVIVETTGDCPLIDSDIVERTIQTYRDSGADYVSNFLHRDYPIGMETQVFATDILADVARRTDDPSDHEHVSLYIYNHPELYTLQDVVAPPELTDPDLRLTLDTIEDFHLLDRVFQALYPTKPNFGLADILELLRNRPELRTLNAHVRRKPL